MTELGHLVRRFAGSLSRRPPAPSAAAWAESHLLDGELRLWRRMSTVDRRHAIAIARRFVDLAGSDPGRAAIAGALLHDVGKIDSALGTVGRVAATVVGPRTDRFQRYRDHERIGSELLARAGADALTVDLVGGGGPPALAAALAAADHI